MALLGKWKWRMLNDGEAVWADLLRFRYGHIPSLLLGDQASSYGSNSSIWCRDVISSNRLPVENWFKSNVVVELVMVTTSVSGSLSGTEINLFVSYSLICLLKRLAKMF
jgi:hypothetical protein